MLLPILHGVDREAESAGESGLGAFQFSSERFDINVIRHMNDESIGDFAPRESASLLRCLEQSRSNSRHHA
jgi:hypothetical protein